jgi:hypothetical protein
VTDIIIDDADVATLNFYTGNSVNFIDLQLRSGFSPPAGLIPVHDSTPAA